VDDSQTAKKSKQSNAGAGPLAALQAAMEDEVRSSQIKGSGTKSPDMFDSEEENGDAAEGDEIKTDGKEKGKGKAVQPKKQKKNEALESCKVPSKENEESESDDSGEDMGNSKSRMIGRQLEKELENSSATGGTGGKEKAVGEQSKPKGNKDVEGLSTEVENDTDVPAQGIEGDVVSKADKDAKAEAGEKTSPTAGNPSKAGTEKKQNKVESSSSSDSDSDTEGFSGAEESKAKKVVSADIKKRKTEQSSSSGSDSESDFEEEKSSKVVGPKSSSQVTKASTINKSPIAVSPSKGGEKATEKKDKDSSSSESESETEARPTTKTSGPKSASTAAPVASKNPPQGFSAPRLESFKKSGLPSPGSIATTSGPKGSISNTSVSMYDSPKTVKSAQVQESGSGSSGSSDDESSEEEMTKKNVAGIKKVKAKVESSSSESDSSDNEDARAKVKRPVASKTSMAVSKPTEVQGIKKPTEKVVNADGNNKKKEAVKDKNGKEMQKKEEVSAVKSLPKKATSPTKSLKAKESGPLVLASKAVEQGKAVLEAVGLKETATSPVKTSPGKSSPVKTSPVKSSDVKSQDKSSAKTSLDLGNKKKANTQEGKEKGEPPEKIAKLLEKDSSSHSKKKEGNVRKQVEKKADNEEIKEKKGQPDENLAKEPKKKIGAEAEKEVEKETASSSGKKTELSTEKKSPQLSSTLVPRNNPVEKLKIQEMDCSPILKKVKDAFGSYFEKTMMDGEEMGKKKEKTESGAQEGKEESVKKKKKKNKKQKKPEAGFL